jgi:hypothetical protein
LSSGAALSENGQAQASMGVAIGDVFRRGRWSIFVTNFSDEYNAFYRHERDFQFTDASYATQTAKPSLPLVGWGAGFFDYDNDGWLDLLVANGHVYPQVDRTASQTTTYRQRKLLYRNRRDGTFSEDGQDSGSALSASGASRGAAFGDLDNDGDVDVVITDLDGAPTILRNDGGNRNNFLVIDLVGTKSNRSALGARVKVTSGDFVQTDETRSGGSYISQNDTRLHFGLERRTNVTAVQVRWPNGARQDFTKVPANAFITVTEGEPVWRFVLQK